MSDTGFTVEFEEFSSVFVCRRMGGINDEMWVTTSSFRGAFGMVYRQWRHMLRDENYENISEGKANLFKWFCCFRLKNKHETCYVSDKLCATRQFRWWCEWVGREIKIILRVCHTRQKTLNNIKHMLWGFPLIGVSCVSRAWTVNWIERELCALNSSCSWQNRNLDVDCARV